MASHELSSRASGAAWAFAPTDPKLAEAVREASGDRYLLAQNTPPAGSGSASATDATPPAAAGSSTPPAAAASARPPAAADSSVSVGAENVNLSYDVELSGEEAQHPPSAFVLTALTIVEKARGQSGQVEELGRELAKLIQMTETPRAEKMAIMERLAQEYNNAETTAEQKAVIEYAFEESATQGFTNGDAFTAGMRAVSKLNQADGSLLGMYVRFFAMMVKDGSALAQDQQLQGAYLDAVVKYADARPDVMNTFIRDLTSICFDRPQSEVLWKALMRISTIQKSYEVEVNDQKKTYTYKDGVLSYFWAAYAKAPASKRSLVAYHLTKSLDDASGVAHAEILVTLIRGEESQRERMAIQRAVLEMPWSQPSGFVRRQVLLELIRKEEANCKAGGSVATPCHTAELDALYALHRPSVRQWSVQLSGIGRSVVGFGDGTRMQRVYGGSLTVDRMSPEGANGLRWLIGGHAEVAPGYVASGVRAGVGTDLTDSLSLKLPAEVGAFYLHGPETGRTDMPIVLSPINGGVTADGEAYAMLSQDVESRIIAGYATVNPELNYVFSRSHMGNGMDLSFLGTVGLMGGLYLGSIKDDDVSYTYQPGGPVTIQPDGQGGYTATHPTKLDGRVRQGNFAAGAMYGIHIGAGVQF